MRLILPEILDSLPSAHPEAVAARRDLRWINAVMGNSRWLVSRLRTCLEPGDVVVELGAGDATLAQSVRSAVPPGFQFSYEAVDRTQAPSDWPSDPRFRWNCGDMVDAAAVARATVVVSCLVLHHETTEGLARLASRFTEARLILAREPARRRRWMRFGLYPLGLSAVTRHDMAVSIDAGFVDDELAAAFALEPANWKWSHRMTFFNAYQFEARRMPAGAEGPPAPAS